MSANTKKTRFTHTISMLVANKPGVLMRIAMTFARRGFNIDSLVVSPSANEKYSRMTVTAQGDPSILDQIIRQVNKLIDVIHAWEHNDEAAVHSELALFKLRKKGRDKRVVSDLIKAFRARVIDDSEDCFIVEQVGTTEELDNLENVLKKYGIVEMVRSGKVIMVKGHQAT
ncbi:MAG: acetolactate synthase small subunit [Candidatus Omnitrophota bacterium]